MTPRATESRMPLHPSICCPGHRLSSLAGPSRRARVSSRRAASMQMRLPPPCRVPSRLPPLAPKAGALAVGRAFLGRQHAGRSNSAPGPALRRDSVSGSRGPWDGGTLDISSALGRRPRRTGARWRTGSLCVREEEEIHETLPPAAPGGERGVWCEPIQLLRACEQQPPARRGTGRSSHLILWLFQGTPRTRARPMLRAPVACPRPPAFCGCSFCVWFVSYRDRTFSQESFFSAPLGKHAASSLLENALLRSLLKNSPFDVYKRGLPQNPKHDIQN